MFRWLLDGFTGLLARVLKYQVVTKALMALGILPLYGALTAALVAGEGAVTNATISSFLLSWRGVVLIILTVALLAIGFVVEFGGFVVLTARAQLGEPPARSLSIVRLGLRRLRNMAGIGGLVLACYVLLLAPLTGIGSNFSFLSALKVPNFIMAFISGNPVYFSLYIAAVVLVVLLSLAFAYTFHLVFLADLPAGRAMLTSARLVWRNKRIFITTVLAKGAAMAALVALSAAVWWSVVLGLMLALGTDSDPTRILFSALLLLQYVVVFFLALLVVPYTVHLLTRAYLRSIAADPALAPTAAEAPDLKAATGRSLLDRVFAAWKPLTAAGLVVLIGLATVIGTHFDAIYRPDFRTEIVGHRAGGTGSPENSISGLKKSISRGADWVEIDIQRTRDGHYVLNHDPTFKRVAGVDRAAKDMTLDEVRKIDISTARDGSEHVPEFEEFLRAAAGKIKVIIELKGETADEKMGLDAWALANRLGIGSDVMLMSIDYDVVRALEKRHPEIPTGYVFFFSIGNPARLIGDYIIIEEGHVSPVTMAVLELSGKRTFVWTVNRNEDVRRVYQSGTNGIITDEVPMVTRTLKEIRQESTLDVFLWLFLNTRR